MLSRTFVHCALLIWAMGVCLGFVLVLQYEGTAGESGQDRPELRRGPLQTTGTKTLIMLAHPRCPCTRASLAELDRIMTRWHGRIEAHVYFLQPDTLAPNWCQGESWDIAAALPGVQVHADPQGRMAKELGGKTSGQVVLLDETGRLLFNGGITGSRGHQGDNPGCQAVLNLLKGDPVAPQPIPVFGCPLFDSPSTCCEDSTCPK
jgi:hypothetical protein